MNEIEPKKTDIGKTSETEIPPSLDLAFEWEKNVLNDQSRSADALETKATTLFSVATVILGLGISVGVLRLHGIKLESIIFGALSLASYGFVIGFAFAAMRLRRYETLDNPIVIREWYWDMKPPKFKTELLAHMEDAYVKNEISLSSKAKATRYLIAATAAEVMLMVISLTLSL